MTVCRYVFSGIFLGISEEDAGQRGQSHQERIIKIGQDADRVQRGQSGSHQHLGAVWYQPLCETGEGIQDAGAFPLVHTVFLRNVVGQRTYRDDGHRVVGRTEVDQADQGGYAQFRTPFGADMSRQDAQQIVDTPVVADQFHQAAGQHGDDDQFAHVGNALSHGREPLKQTVRFSQHADHAAQYQTQCQHDHHVHSDDGREQDDQVRNDLHPVDVRNGLRALDVYAHQDIKHEGDCRSRNHDLRVDLKLVTQFAALRTGGRNGRVGNERQVVAEEGTAHHDGHQLGHVGMGFLGDTGRNGRQGNDRTYRRTDGQRNEAGSQKDTSQQQIVRQEFQ